MRVTEFFQVLPSIVLAIVLVAVFEPGLPSIVFAIGITHWTRLARLTRAEFLKIKERELVLAQRAAGGIPRQRWARGDRRGVLPTPRCEPVLGS